MRIKLLLLGLLTPLLCGVSFASFLNGFQDYIVGTYYINKANTYNIKQGYYYCYEPFNPAGYTSNSSMDLYSYISMPWGGCSSVQNMSIQVGQIFCFQACDSQTSFGLNREVSWGDNWGFKLYEFDSPLSPGKDCSSVESELATMSGNYNTCLNTLNEKQGLLSTCQSDLSSCQNGCDVMVSQCTEDLSGCNENLTSMTNYADSLSSQLNECLANVPEPCEGTGCDEIATGINAVFSFFWENENEMFSLPVANNVFLPRGYRAYVDSGVVAITEIEKTKYYVDDNDKEQVNVSFFSYIFLLCFIFICSLFAYYMKRFVLKFFNGKYK